VIVGSSSSISLKASFNSEMPQEIAVGSGALSFAATSQRSRNMPTILD